MGCEDREIQIEQGKRRQTCFREKRKLRNFIQYIIVVRAEPGKHHLIVNEIIGEMGCEDREIHYRAAGLFLYS